MTPMLTLHEDPIQTSATLQTNLGALEAWAKASRVNEDK